MRLSSQLSALVAAVVSLWAAVGVRAGEAEKHQAVVIGITKYNPELLKSSNIEADPGKPENSGVKYCAENAAEIDKLLTRMGYTVHLCNTPETTTKKAIEKTFDKVKKNVDSLVVIFLGHGLMNGKRQFVLPADAEIKSQGGKEQLKNLIDEQAIYNQCSKINAVKTLIILDACRNSPPNLQIEGESKAVEKIPETFRVISSCQAGERTLLVEAAKASAFARPLIEALEGKAANGNLKISINGVYKFVKDEMPKWLKKIPKYSDVPDYNPSPKRGGNSEDMELGQFKGTKFVGEVGADAILNNYKKKTLAPFAELDNVIPKDDWVFKDLDPRLNLFHASFKMFNKDAKKTYKLDFSGADLTGADFSGAKLKGAIFRGCLLAGATFNNADLTEADFTGAMGLALSNFEGATKKDTKGIPE